jgi:hypothetical protein
VAVRNVLSREEEMGREDGPAGEYIVRERSLVSLERESGGERTRRGQSRMAQTEYLGVRRFVVRVLDDCASAMRVVGRRWIVVDEREDKGEKGSREMREIERRGERLLSCSSQPVGR